MLWNWVNGRRRRHFSYATHQCDQVAWQWPPREVCKLRPNKLGRGAAQAEPIAWAFSEMEPVALQLFPPPHAHASVLPRGLVGGTATLWPLFFVRQVAVVRSHNGVLGGCGQNTPPSEKTFIFYAHTTRSPQRNSAPMRTCRQLLWDLCCRRHHCDWSPSNGSSTSPTRVTSTDPARDLASNGSRFLRCYATCFADGARIENARHAWGRRVAERSAWCHSAATRVYVEFASGLERIPQRRVLSGPTHISGKFVTYLLKAQDIPGPVCMEAHTINTAISFSDRVNSNEATRPIEGPRGAPCFGGRIRDGSNRAWHESNPVVCHVLRIWRHWVRLTIRESHERHSAIGPCGGRRWEAKKLRNWQDSPARVNEDIDRPSGTQQRKFETGHFFTEPAAPNGRSQHGGAHYCGVHCASSNGNSEAAARARAPELLKRKGS